MALQDTYSETIRPAVAGQIANQEANGIISRSVETVAGIGFGKVVQEGTLANSCKSDLTGMDAFTYLGVTVRDRSVRPETPDTFARYESARIMRKGVIWVMTDAAVTKGTDVTVTLATGGLGSAAVGAGIVQIPNARWDTTTAAAGLAKLRLG